MSSSNYNRRGGGGGGNNSNRGGGGSNRNRNKNRSRHQQQYHHQRVTTSTGEDEDYGYGQQGGSSSSQQVAKETNSSPSYPLSPVGAGSPTATTQSVASEQINNNNESSSNNADDPHGDSITTSSSDSTVVMMNTTTTATNNDAVDDGYDEDEYDEDGKQGGGGSNSDEEQEKDNDGDDEGDEEIDEPPSVVNASLFVNLSNANVSTQEEVMRGDVEGLLLEESDSKKKEQVIREDSLIEKTPDHGDVAVEKQQQGVTTENKSSSSDPVITAKLSVSPNSNDGDKKEQQQSQDFSIVEDITMPTEQSSNTHNLSTTKPTPSSPEQQQQQQQKPSGSGASSTASSTESTTLADSEVANLMSHQSGGDATAIPDQLPQQLPSTVTVLTAPNGVQVYLVGTAHFSRQSQVDVVQTIQMTQPTIVVLELCSSRRNILSLDEETVLKEVSEMNFQKIRLALSNSGTVQGTLHLLLLSMSAQLTRKLGMAPGGEFRVAVREARKIPGCVMLLGDRPFNITISRALAALSFFQKIKLAWQFLTSNEDITREEIEKCKEKDLLERMLSEMTGEFPSITEVFVNERDVYLAHSLYLAATSDAHRSNGGPVVGVVGMGHVPGIVRNWGLTTDEGVGRIIRIPETPLSSIIIRKTFKLVLYTAGLYGAYRIGSRVLGNNFISIYSDKVSNIIGSVRVNEIIFKGV